MLYSRQEGNPEAKTPTEGKKTPAWRVALLLLSSACLSGIAVVIWNRQSLKNMRAIRANSPRASDEFI